MQNSLNLKPDDEIGLRELFTFLWAYKLLILSSCILGILIGFYHIQNTNKKFTSSATFKLDTDSMNVALDSDRLGSLAGLTGFGGQLGTDLPIDQVAGRIFIQKIDSELNFREDPYFNTYNPNSVDPVWKSYIKRAIGLKKPSIDTEEAIWQRIVNNYTKNVVLIETKEGSARVVVTHADPQRAAKIANGVMNEIITNAKIEKITMQEERLAYLSNTLAKSLGDLEVSQSSLKEFTLANSALPLENFAAGSLALDALREQLKRTNNLHEAVAEISLMLENTTINQSDYLELRQRFPIVDQVEFRRVLGQNEIMSSWTWPDANSVEAVFNTLSERKSRLQSQINALQIDAERSSLALENYDKLEREAKISEATYTVLIEQVKAQSISAGYQPDRSEVYEYASASIYPSSPKRNQILSIGFILGLCMGIGLSYILALLRDVYYTRRSLKSDAQARLTFSIKSLLRLRNKNLIDLNAIFIQKPNPILRDMAMEIHKTIESLVVVTSSRAKLNSIDVARALASYMQSETLKIAVIDFSSKVKKLDIDEERLSVGPFIFAQQSGHVSVLIPDGDLEAMELLGQKDFLQNIHSLNSEFDLVFLCADNRDAISLLSTFEGQKIFHITLARIKKTKSATLKKMRSRLPIQGLLHD